MFMRRKKGFSLVEMLVVIAIIAVLVSIVIPTVAKSTVKSAAATNAANLRAIEGKLSTMRVENPQGFVDAIDKLGEQAEVLADYFLPDEWVSGEDASDLIRRLVPEEYLNAFLNGGSALGDFANYHIFHTTATSDGVIRITVQPEIVLTDVPAAKAVDIENMSVAKDTPMTVFISNKAIVATYEFNGKSYTKDDFAEVAENGEFTGEASGGATGEYVDGRFVCSTTGNHVLASGVCACKYCSTPMEHPSHSQDGVCTNCKANVNHTWGQTEPHTCACGKTHETPNHQYADGSYSCSICGYYNSAKAEQDGKCALGKHTYSGDYCSNCGAERARCTECETCTGYDPNIMNTLGNWGRPTCDCGHLKTSHIGAD